MSAALCDPLSDIIVLSETMLCCAEQGKWLELADLEARRYVLIAAAKPPLEVTAIPAYARSVQRILALDRRTQVLAQAGHSVLAKQLRGINIGRSAVHAYRNEPAEAR